MSLYDKDVIQKAAADNGFRRDVYEKMCRLTEVLSVISKDETLKDLLALKGGTAINLAFMNVPRLSVDIDMDLAQNFSRDDMLSVRKKISDKLLYYMSVLGYEHDSKLDKNVHALHSMKFSYRNSGGNKDYLKLEINYTLREHLLDLQRCSVNGLNGFTPSDTLCVNPMEIYAAKIVALTTRAAARDLYDVHNMIQSNFFNKEQFELVRKCAIIYGVLNSDNSFEKFNTDLMERIPIQKIIQNLFPVIHQPTGKFDLEGIKKEVVDFLNDNFQINSSEKKFIEKFYGGDLKPQLIFDDANVCNRIEKHPMIKWKLSKVKQNMERVSGYLIEIKSPDQLAALQASGIPFQKAETSDGKIIVKVKPEHKEAAKSAIQNAQNGLKR